MGLFKSFDINASGMTAERYRMDVIAENVANANTTRTSDGTPYRRKIVVFEEKQSQGTFSSLLNSASNRYTGDGVKVSGTYDDTYTQMNKVYDPANPDADENGYVTYPNVNTVTEMTNLIDANRAFEANTTAFASSKNVAEKGLNIINA
ncbi:MAG: flagellar basal body rod protein FlgC [Lachnospiraceae bacterium]|jgi:flagellar basal-body rod protein FlgC|nr:flagellar basal body rod protein FlgC [Lachnospiraceae bacterium]